MVYELTEACAMQCARPSYNKKRWKRNCKELPSWHLLCHYRVVQYHHVLASSSNMLSTMVLNNSHFGV